MNKEEYKAFCLAQAQWWLVSAQTGHYKQRKIYYSDDSELTDEEKLDSCMGTAQTHLKNYREACEQ